VDHPVRRILVVDILFLLLPFDLLIRNDLLASSTILRGTTENENLRPTGDDAIAIIALRTVTSGFHLKSELNVPQSTWIPNNAGFVRLSTQYLANIWRDLHRDIVDTTPANRDLRARHGPTLVVPYM
jgi:hypothetical protein